MSEQILRRLRQHTGLLTPSKSISFEQLKKEDEDTRVGRRVLVSLLNELLTSQSLSFFQFFPEITIEDITQKFETLTYISFGVRIRMIHVM